MYRARISRLRDEGHEAVHGFDIGLLKHLTKQSWPTLRASRQVVIACAWSFSQPNKPSQVLRDENQSRDYDISRPASGMSYVRRVFIRRWNDPLIDIDHAIQPRTCELTAINERGLAEGQTLLVSVVSRRCVELVAAMVKAAWHIIGVSPDSKFAKLRPPAADFDDLLSE
jgi:hypothetical protein